MSGGHLFRKVKKGLSVHFTLEIKLGFKWWPLTGGRICSVTNFTPSPSPGGSPAWPHPGNLWPPFAWTKRAEGRVFRPTEITCLHKQYEGVIPGFLSHNRPHVHYYDNSATQRQYHTTSGEIGRLCHPMANVFIISCGSLLFIEGLPYLNPCKWHVLPFSGYVQWKCVPAAKIFTLGPNHPRSSLLTCKECCHNRAGAAVHRIQSVTPRCPLCPQTCVQYQYALPYTFYLSVFVSCNQLSGRDALFTMVLRRFKDIVCVSAVDFHRFRLVW